MRTLRLHTLALLVVSFDAAAVSFDCVKAVSRTEQLICSDPDLGQMDDAVAQAYALARQRLGNPSALVREQRAWLAKRDSCRERNCVKKAYEGRIQQLQVASDAKRGGGAGRVDILAKRANTLPYGLVPSFSRDARICKEIFAKASSLPGCRAYDESCPDKTDNSISTVAADANDSVGVNIYGYTEIHLLRKLAPPYRLATPNADDPLSSEEDDPGAALPDGVALLYVNRFQGDRIPPLLQTWKVDQVRLEEALAKPLPPIDADRWNNRERNAAELAAVLEQGERLSDEWSPILVIQGRPYIAERECSGRWGYGGYYVCNKIVKLTFTRIVATGKSIRYCQLSLPPKKQSGP